MQQSADGLTHTFLIGETFLKKDSACKFISEVATVMSYDFLIRIKLWQKRPKDLYMRQIEIRRDQNEKKQRDGFFWFMWLGGVST